MATVFIGPTHEAAQKKVDAAIAAGMPAERAATSLIGDPDSVAEQAQKVYVDAGIEGLTISGGGMAHDLEALELTGQALGPVFAGAAA